MTKFGQVYEYNETKRLAGIRFDRPDACKKCGACGGGSQKGTISLVADCQVGDWVRVEFPEGRFLSATAIAYVMPLLGLFAGIGAGFWLGGGGDGAVLAGALAGIGLSLGALTLINRRIAGDPAWTPRVTEVYGSLPDLAQIGCQAE